MSSTNEAPQPLPGDSARAERNRENDEELLRLMRAYRAKGHAKGRQLPSPEQQSFVAKLYAFIDRTAGVICVRNGDGVIQHEIIGWLARECGLQDRADEFATSMKVRLENNAQRDGGYLAKWTEDGGATIATYVTNMGRDEIAKDFGRRAVEDAIRVAEPYRARSAGNGDGESGSDDSDDELAELGIREKADRAIADRKKTGQDAPRVEFDSLSAYEPDTSHGSDGKIPSTLPANLRTSESPVASFLRVSALVGQLQSLGEEMRGPNASVMVKGRKRILTMNHRNVWLAYLGLTPEQHDDLDVSLSTLCETYGWSVSNAKAMLADCFAFLQAHKCFDAICDLMVPTVLTKHLDQRQDAEQFDNRRNEVKKLLDGSDAATHGRAMFRSLIQMWIAKYSDPGSG
jgi:hypothetical protein